MPTNNPSPSVLQTIGQSVRQTIKALASIKMAVVIILSLGTLTAWGTIVEARFNAVAASKIVYQSVWMYTVIGMLCLSLIAVMIDRWPWKTKHTGFILAHIGIIILMIGSFVTHVWGIDGSVTLTNGQPARNLISGQTDFSVYASLDGSSWRKLYDREVDFFLHPPSESKPVIVEIPASEIKVSDYYPYAFREEKIVPTTGENAGSAVRFELQNPMVNMTDWLLQPAKGRDVEKNLGPATVVLAGGDYKANPEKNMLILRPKTGAVDDDTMTYEIHTKSNPKNVKRGEVKAGSTVETGWMGIVLRVLKYIPKAENQVTFIKNERPTELTTSAIKVQFQGHDQWLQLNSMVKLYTDQAVYIVSYGNRRIDLGFDITLNEFKVGRYPGTMRAASYESVVTVPGIAKYTIAMNEPLKFNGYTLYQASFNEDPTTGKPSESILSVNWDPGRWIKYLGSFLIVAGTIHLFWFKRRQAKAATKTTASKVKV